MTVDNTTKQPPVEISPEHQALLDKQEARQLQNAMFQSAMSELQDKKNNMDLYFNMQNAMNKSTKDSIDAVIQNLK